MPDPLEPAPPLQTTTMSWCGVLVAGQPSILIIKQLTQYIAVREDLYGPQKPRGSRSAVRGLQLFKKRVARGVSAFAGAPDVAHTRRRYPGLRTDAVAEGPVRVSY
jgi:hypothetical protein